MKTPATLKGIQIAVAAILTLLLTACGDGTFPLQAPNHAPVANNQTVSTAEDIAKVIMLSGSDSDGDALTYTITHDPQHGTLGGTAPNLTYTPQSDFNGTDSFTFKVNDGTDDSNEATVSITVSALNHAPTANGRDYNITKNTTIFNTIALSASDPDGDTLTYIIETNATHGTLSNLESAPHPKVSYTPDTNYTGADSFTFKVYDGNLYSAPATVRIQVLEGNQVPVANPASYTFDENSTANTITLTGSDGDDDPLTYTVMNGPNGPQHGTLSGTEPNLTYTPAAGYVGDDSFMFTVNDGQADSLMEKVSISINSVSNTTTLYVTAEDGDGNYTCNGTHDQAEINAALDRVASDGNLTTVYLKGPMTCVIEEPIVISSHTKLIGDANVTVRLKDHTDWPYNKPLIAQKGGEHWEGGAHEGSLGDQIYGTENDNISDVEIGGFELTAGTQDASTGSWYYILMMFYSATDLKVHDMYLHHSYGDFIRIMSYQAGISTRVKFYHNRMEHSGHDGLYLGYISDLEIYDNTIYSTRTNDGIRVEECDTVSIHGNTVGNSLTNVPSGYAGILLGNSEVPAGSAAIYDNYIYGKAGGIVLEGGSTKNFLKGVHVHHNRIFKPFDNTAGGDHFLNGGIHIHGAHNTLIEFNTIEGSAKDGIVFEIGEGTETGYQTIVRNNIISNSVGCGLNDLNSSIHTFVSEYNDIYNSSAGDYNNTSSSTDIHADPLYAASIDTNNPDAVDLHLKSEYGRWNGTAWVTDSVTSPAIDAGKSSSDYSQEPTPNGGRVNIGAYGNTPEASKSQD